MTETPKALKTSSATSTDVYLETQQLLQMSTWKPQTTTQPELEEAPLTKRQFKHRRNKDSKLAKKFKSLEAEIDNLKSQMGALKDKITEASESTDAGFKRKKIRSMKREADKINEKLKESEKRLGSLNRPGPLKPHPPNRYKCIEKRIAGINKKIRRVKKKKNKEALIAKREALRAELNWGPRQLEGTFSGAYRRCRIDGIPGMDLDTFFNRIRRFLIYLLKRESRTGAVRAQATT